MAKTSTIVDARGRPFQVGTGARADLGGVNSSMFPYNAASLSSQQMGNWMPMIRSPDSEINLFRDRVVGRTRDLVRNDGWASGGILRILDNVIGTHLRLAAKPDYRALKARFGGAFDATWADEFRRVAEALWRGYADHPQRWNDLERQLTMGQQFRLAMRHKLIDGEGLAVMHWREDRVGYGGADYATCLQLIDPDRLSNPYGAIDTANLRGGIEVDDDGVRRAAHIRKAHQYDWYLTVAANTWERIEFEDPEDGWTRVIHDFDRDRAGQHRGVSVFTPVLQHAKMLANYYGVELQQATLAAQLGLYTKSPYDPALVQDAIAGGEGQDELAELNAYQQMRADWSRERPAFFNGVRVPTLAPGEEIVSVASEHPHSNFGEFAHEMLRIMAAALGVSAEQVTQDWSRTNYSSARAALMESWKTLMRRRLEFTTNFATPVYSTWLREAMGKGELPLPNGAPDFAEAAAAYSGCKWLGPARGWIDPVKEPAGSVLRMEAGISTLEGEAAEQGADWEEVAEQRAIEQRFYEDRGLPPPKWAAIPGQFLDDDSEQKAQEK